MCGERSKEEMQHAGVLLRVIRDEGVAGDVFQADS